MISQAELSKDAAIVRYVQTQLARAGFAGDVFGLVSRDDAAWTRERWDNAVSELDQARHVWHQGNVLNRLSDRTALGAPRVFCSHQQRVSPLQGGPPMLPNSPRFRLASRGAVVRCPCSAACRWPWRSSMAWAIRGRAPGHTRPATGVVAAWSFRIPRRMVAWCAYGRAVETKEQMPKAKRHDHPPHAAPQHASADGWQARYGATVHGTGCRYFPLHVDVQSGTLAGSETFCHAAGQRSALRALPGDRTMEAVAPPPTFRLTPRPYQCEAVAALLVLPTGQARPLCLLSSSNDAVAGP